MKKYFVFLLGTISVLLSLHGCNSIYTNEHLKNEYERVLKFFDSTLVNHFPKKLPDKCSFSTNVALAKIDYEKESGFSSFYADLKKKYSNKRYSKIKNIFISSSKAVYDANSEKLLLIFSYNNDMEINGEKYTNLESLKRRKLAKLNLIATSFPIPLFEIDQFKSNTFSGLPEDFKIYVLEAKPGKYLEDKYLRDCVCLPEKWKHGFSKGVAMSDKRHVIIYWVTVW